ncbi:MULTISPECIES: hypothetical protein [Pasteurellaceae]|uniref:Putative Lhr family helicase, phage associatd n=1 Tax=Avibacterium paragallinarum TaxID=728 RepID=A0A0F5ESL1_AVIPA|nr:MULTISPECIES: hypothetical protein [Pasteurellaceae]AZI14481.1 helicase [Avibacterium paragallinarum]KGQ40543.1 helicase [Gallibacterium anatis]KGQ40648.1 helicase [Gallibacterium anatis IPDH697-78]MDA3978605.1 helicase [Gallibacterium sp. AGMB14963]MDK9560948.1 helicase [Gallibacterium anatis]
MQFVETSENNITYIHTEFNIENVTYLAIFSKDDETLFFFNDDVNITKYIHHRQVYSIKFLVKDYLETENDDLYAPPLDHKFGKKQIAELKQKLEEIVYQHYLRFKPDCYVFVGERPSLIRMYKKLCANPSDFMVNFKPITDLGSHRDCFVIKTPSYKEE